ncbi:hypothetical protein [uncultured Metabacillus sp.]|uniref:hypothetical protein n=1 Tax=Metabacillus sp. Hm71 TaxID=3450743 RepID=UPI00262E1650|nr:hypothetical protein [uncultured Metabacillus sp.]
MDAKELLDAYRQLWVNRSMYVKKDDFETLWSSIVIELKDEMTHPRLRKTPEEKFHSAIKRIISSSLPDTYKVKLIELHSKVFEEVKK